MKKIIIVLLITLTFNISYSYGESIYLSGSENTAIPEPILEIIPEPISEEIKDTNIIEDVYSKRKQQIKNLIDLSKEEKDIEAIENLKLELEIKKSTDKAYLDKINSELLVLQEEIEKNNLFLKSSEKVKEKNSELSLKIKEIERNNSLLRRQSKFKEDLIRDLKNTINNYEILEEKYKNLLLKYVDIKKSTKETKKEETEKKLKIFYLFLLISALIYLVKILIKNRLNKKYEPISSYFDLVFTLIITLCLIGFFFFFFPQLYIMLLFISGYLLFINQSIIASFIGSIIILKNYNIGDVIKHKKDFGRIIKITPLFTIIRILNENGVLTNRRENIPNILLTKEQVTVYKNPELQEHTFDIILPIKNNYNIFKIVEEIKENIISKSLTNRPVNVDKNDEDIFKVKYHQLDLEKVQISFYWIDENIVSTKIEKKILGYVKEHLQDKHEEKVEDSSE